MEPYIWTPDPEFSRTTNIRRLMNSLGVETVEQLTEVGKREPDRLYRIAGADLGIEWFRPYEQTLDLSAGKPWARWFVGGELNVVHNCIDRHVAAGRGGKTALLWEGEDGLSCRYSYGELQTAINRAAAGLLCLGIRPGDRVGLFLPMIPEAIISFFACLKLGAIAVPVFSGFGAAAAAERLHHCDVRFLITADGSWRSGKQVRMQDTALLALKDCPTVEHVIVVERLGLQVFDDQKYLRWGSWLEEQTQAPLTRAMDASDPLMILYTSGSTGRPKGCVHTHGGAQMRMPFDFAYHADVKANDTFLWVTDIGWIMAPYQFIGVLTLGATLLILEGSLDFPSPDRLWALVERHEISILGMAPSAVRALAAHDNSWMARHQLGSLRVLGSSGEPWDPTSYLWYFQQVGGGRCPVINMSGGTEVGGAFLAPLPIQPIKICSLGGPSPGLDMDVVDELGQPVRGRIGELVCRNVWPSMTRGLWKEPERYFETYWSRYPDLWFHGDLASVDEDGAWFLHGRSDDTLQIAGKRVGPVEVESVLMSHPAVVEAAAVGVSDPRKGESLACFIVLQPGMTADAALTEALTARVVGALGKSFRPTLIRAVRELPKTRSGKLMRRMIKTVCAGDDLGNTDGLANPQCLEAIRLDWLMRDKTLA